MTADQIAKFIAYVLGAILSIPSAILLVRASFFVGEMRAELRAMRGMAEDAAKSLSTFTSEVRTMLADHDKRLALIEQQQEWDGEERRHGPGPRERVD